MIDWSKSIRGAEDIAGRYPWLYTIGYITALLIGWKLLGLATSTNADFFDLIAIAALAMAVEARYRKGS